MSATWSSGLRLLALLVAAGSFSACAPRLAPLYRDYALASADSTVDTRIRAALADAGWTVVPSPVPNLIATEERTTSHWGLYQVRVALEVSRVGDEHVRVFVHPYRRYVTGGRSKIPFLKGRLRAQALGDVTEALRERGIHVVGTPFERDRVSMTQ